MAPRIRRREFLAMLPVSIAGLAALAACGGSAATATTEQSTTASVATTTQATTAAATTSAASGAATSATRSTASTTTSAASGAATSASSATPGAGAGTPSIAGGQSAVLKPGVPHSVDELLKPDPNKFASPIHVTTVWQSFANNKYAAGDSMNDNPWTRAYKDKYGVQAEKLWEVPGDQYQQKLNLTIASGDLPDFFMATPPQFAQLLAAGTIQDLTDMYAKFATERTKALLYEGGDTAMKSSMINGRLMAIPYILPTKEGSPLLWLRTDLLKKYNLGEPKTLQDQLAIVETFGKNNIYSFSVDKLLGGTSGFFNSYHAYPNIWLKDSSGKLVYGSVQPEIKQPLEQLQKMYKAGQLDPEFGVKDPAKARELVVAGKVGMIYGAFSSGAVPLQQAKEQNPDSDWKAYHLPSVDGQRAVPQVNEPEVNGYFVAKKGFAHPEAMFMLLDFWIQAFYTTTSDDVYDQYNNTKDNIANWQHNVIQSDRAWKNIDEGLSVANLVDAKGQGAENATPEERQVYGKCQQWLGGDIKNWSWYAMFGPGGSSIVANDYRQNNWYQESAFFGAPTATMGTKLSSLQDLQAQEFTKIIQGAALAEFDSFVANWKKQGGDQITSEVNDWYAKQK
jgi:putative aldouronate transport system substrate-binding protein